MSDLLFSNQTSNGNSSVIVVPPRRPNKSEKYTVIVFGTFDGCTVKLQASADNSTFVDIPSASWTSATVVNLEMHVPFIRANLSSAGASTSVSLYIS